MATFEEIVNKFFNLKVNTEKDGTNILSRDMVATSVQMCLGQPRENIQPIRGNLAESINTLEREVKRLRKELQKASPEEREEILDRIKTKNIHIKEMRMKKLIYESAIKGISRKPGCTKKTVAGNICKWPNLAFVDYCIYHGH